MSTYYFLRADKKWQNEYLSFVTIDVYFIASSTDKCDAEALIIYNKITFALFLKKYMLYIMSQYQYFYDKCFKS